MLDRAQKTTITTSVISKLCYLKTGAKFRCVTSSSQFPLAVRAFAGQRLNQSHGLAFLYLPSRIERTRWAVLIVQANLRKAASDTVRADMVDVISHKIEVHHRVVQVSMTDTVKSDLVGKACLQNIYTCRKMRMEPLVESIIPDPIQCGRPSSSSGTTKRITSPSLKATPGHGI